MLNVLIKEKKKQSNPIKIVLRRKKNWMIIKINYYIVF